MISLKAAKPGFIGTNNDPELLLISIEDIRKLILNSVKFVFDKSLLDITSGDNLLNMMEFIFGIKGTENTYSKINRSTYDKMFEKLQYKHFEVWKKYGTKLPYPVVFFENETGGLLIFREKEQLRCIIINPTGWIREMVLELGEEFFNTELYESPVIRSHKVKLKNAITEEMYLGIELTCKVIGYMTYKLITFINARNVSIIQAKPTNKEFDKAKISNVIRPKYIYNIVDIYNTKKQYKSLKEIDEFANATISNAKRAHMVRGHFKTRKSGNYWWNDFVRCKDGPGKVIKHYECHDSEG